MPASLNIAVLEGGTIGVISEFFDENGSAVVPKSVKYSLKDKYGNIVNGKDKVDLVANDKMVVPLSGDDLPPGEKNFNIYAVYDSQELGNNRTMVDYVNFNVEDMP